MNELNRDLREQAVHLGLCGDWQKLWSKGWSNEKMVEMMYRGIHFCLKNHYPANDFLLRHFDTDFRRNNGIFVNDIRSAVNLEKSLILGDSDVTLRYNTSTHGIIYLRDRSKLRLVAKNRSFVIVHLFDNSSVNAEQLDSAEIVLIKHSTNVETVVGTSIKIKEEFDYLN